jgi:AcrR family transcriptional regulator
MSVAEDLWRTHGFDEVSVEQVCAGAGVAKGTFYFYFPRKEHLLVMLVRARMAPAETELHALLQSDLPTAQVCAEVAGAIARRARKLDKGLVKRGVEEAFRHYRDIGKLHESDRALRWYFDPIFERGQARGDVDSSWNMETLAGTAGWAMLQGVLLWASGVIPDRDLVANLRERAELLGVSAATSPGAAAVKPPARLRPEPPKRAGKISVPARSPGRS